jgi:hypothetical protein
MSIYLQPFLALGKIRESATMNSRRAYGRIDEKMSPGSWTFMNRGMGKGTVFNFAARLIKSHLKLIARGYIFSLSGRRNPL